MMLMLTDLAKQRKIANRGKMEGLIGGDSEAILPGVCWVKPDVTSARQGATSSVSPR